MKHNPTQPSDNIAFRTDPQLIEVMQRLPTTGRVFLWYMKLFAELLRCGVPPEMLAIQDDPCEEANARDLRTINNALVALRGVIKAAFATIKTSAIAHAKTHDDEEAVDAVNALFAAIESQAVDSADHNAIRVNRIAEC